MKNDSYLAHHGILGMKWGVRRYQNEDGTYTDEGKKRRRLLFDRTGKAIRKSGLESKIPGLRRRIDATEHERFIRGKHLRSLGRTMPGAVARGAGRGFIKTMTVAGAMAIPAALILTSSYKKELNDAINGSVNGPSPFIAAAHFLKYKLFEQKVNSIVQNVVSKAGALIAVSSLLGAAQDIRDMRTFDKNATDKDLRDVEKARGHMSKWKGVYDYDKPEDLYRWYPKYLSTRNYWKSDAGQPFLPKARHPKKRT